jgi:hypothetical protein
LSLGLGLELTTAPLALATAIAVMLTPAATTMLFVLRESCRRHQGRGCHDRGKH